MYKPTVYVCSLTDRNSAGVIQSISYAPESLVEGGTRSNPGKIEGWKRQIERGRGATTPLSGNRVFIKHITPAECIVSSKPDGSGITAHWENVARTLVNGAIPAPSLSTDTIDNQFLQKCYKAATDLNGSTTVAELRRTIAMVKNPLSALRQFFTGRLSYKPKKVYGGRYGLRKKVSSRETARRAARAVAGTHLEFVFGVLPLVRDIQSSAKVLKRLMYKQPYKRVDFRSDERFSSSDDGLMSMNPPARNTRMKWYRTTNEVRSVHVYGTVALTNSLIESVGFDVTSLALTGLEVVPWSFLVDYMIPVSRMLTAAAYPKANLQWCVRTVRSETTRKAASYFHSSSYHLVKFSRGSAEILSVTFDRKPHYPSFHFEGIEFVDGVGQLANSISLLLQRRL